ncbi:putative homeobox-leucine zipper protein GLAB [Helianthus anomalus]
MLTKSSTTHEAYVLCYCLFDWWERWNLVANATGRPRIMARMCTDFQELSGVVMSATHSVWIAANHQHLFEMMLIKELRSVRDLLCHMIATRDMFFFPLSQDEANFNYVSILNSDVSLQTINTPTVALVMRGGDSSRVGLLPTGLSIVPYHGESGQSGSMVGFHMLLPNQVISNITMENISILNKLVANKLIVWGLKMLVDPLNDEGM